MPLSLLLYCFTLVAVQSDDAVARRFSQLSETEQLKVVADVTSRLVASENIVVHSAGELLQLEYKNQEWQPRHALYVFVGAPFCSFLSLLHEKVLKPILFARCYF